MGVIKSDLENEMKKTGENWNFLGNRFDMEYSALAIPPWRENKLGSWVCLAFLKIYHIQKNLKGSPALIFASDISRAHFIPWIGGQRNMGKEGMD